MTSLKKQSKGFARAAIVLFAAAAGICLNAQAPQVPVQLNPPDGERLLVQVHAKGSQIYTCTLDGKQYTWTFKGPEAQLFDKNEKIVGRHYAGPTWEWNDGSQVSGKMVTSVPSPDADSIPWLLLTVKAHSGNGMLAGTTSIQRLNTKGGKASASGCNASHEKEDVQIAYTADYLFWGK